VQQTEPLRGNLYIHKCDTGNVAARSIQAGDETGLDWIASSAENDRDRPSRSLGFHYRSRALWCDNHRHAPTNQIGRQFRQSLIVIVRPAEFDRDIATFHEPSFAQTSAER
jgi:hypothetical protein